VDSVLLLLLAGWPMTLTGVTSWRRARSVCRTPAS